MPPFARSKKPLCWRIGAGEAALLVAEQLALDQVGRDGAAVDGEKRAARALARSCSVCATSSLPVPLSPMISTVASVGATRAIAANSFCIAGELPMRWPKPGRGA